MTTAVMPTQVDIGETAFQQQNRSCRGGMYADQQWQMACSTTTTTTFYLSRHRNLSGPVTGSCNPPALDNRALATPPPGVPGARDSREKEHHNNHNNNRSPKDGSSSRHHHPSSSSSSSPSSSSHPRNKLDRSLSDSEDRINGNNGGGGGGRGVNSSRYKTELCRPFEESGHCKYGDKCQFAHGAHELRNLTRHPKYKTELCRTYHSIGFCPYGPRCHFIHNEDEKLINQRKNSNCSSNGSSGGGSPRLSPSSSSSSSSSNTNNGRQCHPMLLTHSPTGPNSGSYHAQRPSNLCGLNSLGSSFESVSSSSSPGNLSPSHLDDTFPTIGTFSPSAVSCENGNNPGESQRDGSPPVGDSGTVFTFPASDAAGLGSIMTPLNIQTQQMYGNLNMLDMAALARFSAVLNLSQNQTNDQSSFHANNLNTTAAAAAAAGRPEGLVEGWAFGAEVGGTSSTTTSPLSSQSGLGPFPPLSTSPHSMSDDSMGGSNGSLEMILPTPTPTTTTTTTTTVPASGAANLVNSPHDLGRSMRLPIFNNLVDSSESS